MAILSIDQVAAAAYRAGFRGRALIEITAIAMAESGGNTNALNPNGEHSVGLTQMNMRAHGNRFGSQSQLMDPVHNMRAAFALSGGGQSFRPWSVHRSSPSPHAGSSNRFLGPATRAASAAAGTPIPAGGGVPDFGAPQATFDSGAQQAQAQRDRAMRVIQGMAEARSSRSRAPAPSFAPVSMAAFEPGQFSQALGNVGRQVGSLVPQVAQSQAPERGRRMRAVAEGETHSPAEEARRRREEDEQLLRGLGGRV